MSNQFPYNQEQVKKMLEEMRRFSMTWVPASSYITDYSTVVTHEDGTWSIRPGQRTRWTKLHGKWFEEISDTVTPEDIQGFAPLMYIKDEWKLEGHPPEMTASGTSSPIPEKKVDIMKAIRDMCR